MNTSMTISPADMLLYVDVVRSGSFTAAARHAGISKQAVSERMYKLESALGVRLLQRTTRSLRMTDAGLRYHAECAQIARQIELANLAVQSEQAIPTGLLRLSAPMLYGRNRLIPAIQTYIARYPNVQVSLRLSDQIVNLVDEGIDVALRVSRLNDSSLSVRRLGEVSAYFVASPALIAKFQGMPDGELIRCAPAVAFRESEMWALPTGVKIKPNAVVTVNDLEALAAAAVQGFGITRMPGILCNPLIAENKLTRLLNRPGF
ncbi:MAG: LysR family transcriptional regulator [Rhodoferax sp.]|nr:LysR family transcriptional regulator [Rhodoferax sp.]